MALRVQLRAHVRQGETLVAQGAGAVADGRAFGRWPVSSLGPAEELAEVRVVSKVTYKGADRADMQVKALGHLIGGEVLQKVGSANLVVPLGGRIGVFKQTDEFLGTCHGS